MSKAWCVAIELAVLPVTQVVDEILECIGNIHIAHPVDDANDRVILLRNLQLIFPAILADTVLSEMIPMLGKATYHGTCLIVCK